MSDNPEFQSQHDAIYTLKKAIDVMHTRTITWPSSDGMFAYMADSPLNPEIEPETFSSMPAFDTLDVLNAWYVRRVNLGRIGLDVMLKSTSYAIAIHTPLDVVDWETPATLFIPDMNDPLAHLEDQENYNRSRQNLLGPVEQDFANLDNAIFDLNTVLTAQRETQMLEKALLTPEDIFRERELKRKWMFEPERNETGGPLWWSVSTASAVFAIFAHTAEEAMQAVEDAFYDGNTPPYYQVGIHAPERQADYEKYAGRKIVRLIPFSSDEFIASVAEEAQTDPINSFDELIDALESAASDELNHYSHVLVELLSDEHSDPTVVQQAWANYSDELARIVEVVTEPAEYAKMQLAALLYKSIIFRNAGMNFRYIEELQDAEIFAQHQTVTDLTHTLDTIDDEITAAITAMANTEQGEEQPEYLLIRLRPYLTRDGYEELRSEVIGGATKAETLQIARSIMVDEDGMDPDELFNFLGFIK